MIEKTQKFTKIIAKEGNLYVSLCPELDIASQDTTVEEAKGNLKEALELFLETTTPKEIANPLYSEILITKLEIAIG